ncbi:MAG: IgGFc-binding protein [Chitinophagaceae bacterium]|nr:IgGFc-binding protein [Chitinophagaceae bacterium]
MPQCKSVSGSKLKSIANAAGDCYPIAVFSGSSRTKDNQSVVVVVAGIMITSNVFQHRHGEKISNRHPTSRPSTAANQFMTNSYTKLVKDPTTVVRRNGVVIPAGTLQQNSFYFFESNSADVIDADKPVMVAQYMTGGGCMGGGVGDPEMIYISPVEQAIKRIGFTVIQGSNTGKLSNFNYSNNGLPSLRIDGSAVFDHTYTHPQAAGYSIVVKRWTGCTGARQMYSDSAFTAITYGLGSVESYAYNAGTYLNNLNAISHLFKIHRTRVFRNTLIPVPVRLSNFPF